MWRQDAHIRLPKGHGRSFLCGNEKRKNDLDMVTLVWGSLLVSFSRRLLLVSSPDLPFDMQASERGREAALRRGYWAGSQVRRARGDATSVPSGLACLAVQPPPAALRPRKPHSLTANRRLKHTLLLVLQFLICVLLVSIDGGTSWGGIVDIRIPVGRPVNLFEAD